MTIAPRRIAGAVLCAAAALALILGGGAISRSRDRSLRTIVTQEARQRTSIARAWLANLLKGMEGQAAAAASLSQIVSIASSSGNADLTATLHDAFRSEPWWESYRRDFSLQGLAFSNEQLDVANTVDGLDASKLDLSSLMREARAHRSASAYFRIGALNWPYAAAAAVVDSPRQTPAVLVLAKSFDLGLARELAKAIDGSVVLSDGAHPLVSAGPNLDAAAQALPGHEKEPVFVSADLTWGAAGLELLPGLTLWTSASIAPQAAEMNAEAASNLALLRIAAGILFLLGIGLLFWPGRRAVAAPGYEQLARSTEITDPAHTAPEGKTSLDAAVTITTGTSDPRLRKEPALAGKTDENEITALQEVSSNVFGRYVLLDLLGEGGMAEVYTAVTYGAEKFRRSFVVKRLRAEMLHNQSVVSSFIDEANLASSLVHSNILPVFDFGKVGDEYYMATEYILGRDLGKLSRKSFEQDEAALSMGTTFFAAHQILEALDYAHQKAGDDGKPLGIVHRDISPNNIMISARGEVKLFDFGIAKAEGRLTQTAFGTVKGNVRFMSPEQARGEKVDSRSDLFSVGLVIYYVLTGDTLYEGDTAFSLLVKAAHGPGETELNNIGKLPREARAILLRALQIDPSLRFQTAAEFATALQPYLSGQQATLGRVMERLFGQELQQEQARFAAAAGAVGEAEKLHSDPARESPQS